jgi:hypothetical protein
MIQVYDRIGKSPWNQTRPFISQPSGRRSPGAGILLRFGKYLGVSADGNTVAVGSVGVLISVDAKGETLKSADLSVVVHRYDGSGWVEVGSFRSDSHLYSTVESGMPLQSLSLSDNGRVLAIASNYLGDDLEDRFQLVGAVQAYEFDGSSWIDRGRLIEWSNG